MDHLYVIGGNGSGGNGSGEPQLELPKTSGETAMETERGSEPEQEPQQELEPIAAAPVEEPEAPAVVAEEAAEVGNDDVGNNAEEGGGEEEDKAGGALCDDGKGEEGVGVDENGGAGLGPITEEAFEPVEDAGGEQVAAEKLEEITGDQVGEGYKKPFVFDSRYDDGDDSGSEEEQAAFMRELETFHKEKSLEFKPPKFYGEGLNCLKLWRAVTRLGGYDQVTSCKLWRQVGESFKPPKTCTTVSWSFRCFYEKALLEYEKHKIRTGELQFALPTLVETMPPENQLGSNQASGRARRDAAARAMQGWHSQRLLGNGEVGDPIIKDRSPASLLKRDKSHKSNGMFKRKKASLEHYPKVSRARTDDTQTLSMVVDVGPPADWVKINVRTTKDCFEVYALVPGLLREEVHVQSDPAGRLVISGDPEQPDNPWGVTPFKKVVTLPSRIDPHQTSAVVTLHGQLFVRAPFEQTEVQAI